MARNKPISASLPLGAVSRWRTDFAPHWREFKFTLYLLRQSPLVVLGFILVAVVVFMALSAPWIASYGPEERLWPDRLQAPSAKHWLGTDESGGDVFSRIVWGARLDLYTAAVVVGVAALVGSAVGAVSGFIGAKTDEAIMRVTDVFLAFPGLILAMTVAAALGRNWTNLMIALMVVWWPGYARLIRGQVLSERERLYVEAARAVGSPRRRIIFRHVLPNSIYPLMVSATLDLGSVILVAAGLSFIGFGAGAGIAEWGRMIADGRNYMFQSPWMATFPGLAILITSVSFNLVGDGLRDVLDPRLRR